MSWRSIRRSSGRGGLALSPPLALAAVAQHGPTTDQRRETTKQSLDATSLSLEISWINEAAVRHGAVTGVKVGPLCCRGHFILVILMQKTAQGFS